MQSSMLPSSTANGTLFEIEGAILALQSYPLKAHRTLETLLKALLGQVSDRDMSRYIEEVCHLMDRLLEQGRFLEPTQRSLLLAWTTELRSQWIRIQGFQESEDLGLLQRIHAELIRQEKSQEQTVQSFYGFYQGAISDGFQYLTQLSDLGYWVIDRADNHVDSRAHQDTLHLRVSLETGLSLSDLQARLPSFGWESAQENEQGSLSLPANSENYWIDWLHLLASEREVWRKSTSFLRFYKSLQEQVRSQFSQPLDNLCEPDSATHLNVLLNSEPPSSVVGFDLYGGRVFLHDQAGAVQKVLLLSESVIPVYRLSYRDQQYVVPIFKVETDGQLAPGSALGWWYEQGGWNSQPLDQETVSYVLLRGANSQELTPILYDEMVREYAVVLRSSCLPLGIQNVWNIRGEFLVEPARPSSNVHVSGVQRHTYSSLFQQTKSRKPVYFELMPSCGVELYSDMVVGLVPVQSLTRLMDCFIYHSGHTVPLIEPPESARRADDMVIIVSSKGVFFAFRGRYSLNQNELHTLVEGDQFTLSSVEGAQSITIDFIKQGWFLLDQRHTYILQTQLLEILT